MKDVREGRCFQRVRVRAPHSRLKPSCCCQCAHCTCWPTPSRPLEPRMPWTRYWFQRRSTRLTTLGHRDQRPEHRSAQPRTGRVLPQLPFGLPTSLMCPSQSDSHILFNSQINPRGCVRPRSIVFGPLQTNCISNDFQKAQAPRWQACLAAIATLLAPVIGCRARCQPQPLNLIAVPRACRHTCRTGVAFSRLGIRQLFEPRWAFDRSG